MTITSLVDDYCPNRGFRGEHGLSLYMEANDTKLLFDTGQGDAFLVNARTLGIDLSGLDAVVLSHGHYDHGGGLMALYGTFGGLPPPLFAGRGFDEPRRSRSEGGYRDIGLPIPILPARAPAAIVIDAFEELVPAVFFLPHAERVDGTEAMPRFRRIVGEADMVDDFDDELSLVLDGKDGIVIVTGCAHRGILNIARAAAQAFPGRPVKALVGGFHLIDASDAVLSQVARDIAALEPGFVLCAHCTGLRGYAALSETVPGEVSWLSCGMSISL
ncbi:MAG: MBL fold metallo-hydrolase [Spirochaetes bacterium]|nr:MBL fold metallo-hydrolase [Spirochaetota bacterium]